MVLGFNQVNRAKLYVEKCLCKPFSQKDGFREFMNLSAQHEFITFIDEYQT